MDTKQCYLCKQTFPATPEYFTADKQRKDGLHPYCKPCRKATRKAEYANSPDQQKHAREKSAEWFVENRERARQNRKAYYLKNRDKAIAYAREWREQNLERYTENNRAYKKRTYPTRKDTIATETRNRRARLAGLPGKHTQKDIEEMLIRQSGRCFYCGDPLIKFQVDHVVPVFQGGPNSPDNLVLACEHCNKSKGARLPEEWKPIY